MLPFLKVNFQEKIPPWLFHRKWSNSSGGDTHRVQSKVLMVPLGTGLLTYLQILHEVHKGLEPRGFSHQFLFVRRLFGSGVPTLPYGFWATRGEMVFPASGWALAPSTSLHRRYCRRKDKENWVWMDRDVSAPHASAFPSVAVSWPHVSHKWWSKNCFVATGSTSSGANRVENSSLSPYLQVRSSLIWLLYRCGRAMTISLHTKCTAAWWLKKPRSSLQHLVLCFCVFMCIHRLQIKGCS